MRAIVLLCVIGFVGVSAAHGETRTLYRWTDANGRVQYADKPPANFKGEVTQVEIDVDAVPPAPAASPKRQQPVAPSNPGKRSPDPQAARDKLEAAKKALADARAHPAPEDIARMGTTSGYTRPVPTEAYKAKLARLEAEVKAAQAELARAEGR